MVDGFFSSIQGTDLKEKLAYSPHALYLVFLFSLGNRGHNVTWCMGPSLCCLPAARGKISCDVVQSLWLEICFAEKPFFIAFFVGGACPWPRAFCLCKEGDARGGAQPARPKPGRKITFFPRNDRPYGLKRFAFQTKNVHGSSLPGQAFFINAFSVACGSGWLPSPRLLLIFMIHD